jgi:hypothetical protein
MKCRVGTSDDDDQGRASLCHTVAANANARRYRDSSARRARTRIVSHLAGAARRGRLALVPFSPVAGTLVPYTGQPVRQQTPTPVTGRHATRPGPKQRDVRRSRWNGPACTVCRAGAARPSTDCTADTVRAGNPESLSGRHAAQNGRHDEDRSLDRRLFVPLLASRTCPVRAGLGPPNRWPQASSQVRGAGGVVEARAPWTRAAVAAPVTVTSFQPWVTV